MTFCLYLFVLLEQSGGEFGVFSDNATLGFGLPGRFGQDFAFINKVRCGHELNGLCRAC